VSRVLTDGAQNWKQRVDKNSSPLAMARSTDNRTLFALRSGLEGRVVALDSATGRELWTNTGLLAASGDTTAVLSRHAPIRALRGVDATSGAPKWRYVMPADFVRTASAGLRIRSVGERLVMSTDCNLG
jgi:hypothetical protein